MTADIHAKFLFAMEMASDEVTDEKSRIDVSIFAIACCCWGRTPHNVLLQWEIDRQSLLEQSMRELCEMQSWLESVIPTAEGLAQQGYCQFHDWLRRCLRWPNLGDDIKDTWIRLTKIGLEMKR